MTAALPLRGRFVPWLALLLSCLAVAAAAQPSTGSQRIGDSEQAVEWQLPAGPALGVAVLEHGFMRGCAQLRGTAAALAAQGLAVLCVEASMAGGNPALADALAQQLVTGLPLPDGRALPHHVVVGGHSAGAAFAARLGARLAALAPDRLAGALLLDPVPAAGFAEDLAAVSAAGLRPVLALAANPGGCNAGFAAGPALAAVRREALAAGRDGFVGLQLTDRSTHVDAEGADTTLLAVAACSQGRPQAFNTRYLRRLAAEWALDMVSLARTPAFYPGGGFVDGMLALEDARVIE